MFVVQLLGPSGARWKSSMDVIVMVELASRIQDLVQNESGELLAHSSPIWDTYHLRKND